MLHHSLGEPRRLSQRRRFVDLRGVTGIGDRYYLQAACGVFALPATLPLACVTVQAYSIGSPFDSPSISAKIAICL
jgi:hypothetical protein